MTEDILEKAKDALDHAISESSGGVYLDPSCNDLLPICRELIAEVERLRSRDKEMAAAIVSMAECTEQYVTKNWAIVESVMNEADSLVDYCEKLEKIVIIKVAEIERLRSAVAHYKQELSKLVEVANAENQRNYGRIEEKDARIKEFYEELTAKIESARRCRDSERKTLNDNLMLKARIKELSDLNEALMENGNDLRERCQKAEGRCQELLDTLKIVSENFDAMFNEHKRLEAAFLEAKRGAIYFQDAPNTRMMLVDLWDVADKKAREALERIRNGE